jgi:peptide deformylase
MALLDILHFPDPRLRKVSRPVDTVDKSINQLLDNMLETMYEAPGIGLAAPQVNVHRRVVTIDVSESRDSPVFLINPVIVATEGTEEMEEGCLSVPDQFAAVTRAESVAVEYLDRDGKLQTLETDGLLAVCIQHEIDHLNGKLFVDYISPLKRTRIRKKMEKMFKAEM